MELQKPTIPNKSETATIPELEIPEWLKNKVKEMMSFAVLGGAKEKMVSVMHPAFTMFT